MKKLLYVLLVALCCSGMIGAWYFNNLTGIVARVDFFAADGRPVKVSRLSGRRTENNVVFSGIGGEGRTTVGYGIKYWQDYEPFGFDTLGAVRKIVIRNHDETGDKSHFDEIMAQVTFDRNRNNENFTLEPGNGPKTYFIEIGGKRFDKDGNEVMVCEA